MKWQSPASLGYRMPAEWEPHAATWLSWPHRRQTWPGHFEPIPDVWVALTRALTQVEPVHICASGAALDEARSLVGNVPNVTLHDIPTNDAWIRDHGPMFLVGPPGGKPLLIDWEFNAWGGKYPAFELDNAVPRRIAESQGYERAEPGIVLEGGAVDFNGQGTVLTTEQCLLNRNRNRRITKEKVEKLLADYCAATHVIWLDQGIIGDDTDGHVDELARFVAPRVVVASREADPQDVNFALLEDCRRRLSSAVDQDGRPLELVDLPMPQPMFFEGQRIPGSYCNFYVANGLVVVPQFGDPADGPVLETFARLFPGRKVQGLPARDLAWGLGAYHCITQQQPALA